MKDQFTRIQGQQAFIISSHRGTVVGDAEVQGEAHDSLQVKNNIAVTSVNGSITLTAGASSLTLFNNGDIELKGVNVNVIGSSRIDLNK
ncbi:hypothetical protein PEC302110_39290 [Pectobacterium araliae]|uniref:Uncharacterized protein n=1 Tax=Pectobacterium araliae TaxID=3073862 RepID=A0AAN0KLX4_9GAMM|nr:hypothetical protein PEC302110_39290 [Pectobacterium sp. MAFF 302110]